MIPEANTYLGNLVEAGTDEVGANKTPRMYLSYEITHKAGITGEWEALEEPLKRDVGFWLSDKAFESSVKTLKEMGWNYDFNEPAFIAEVTTNAILLCEHEDYKGTKSDRWYLEKYRGGFARQIINDKTARQLSSKLEMIKKNLTPPTV